MRYLPIILIIASLLACPSPNYVPTEFQYSEYKCPEPIGVIVRENCRENVIKYQAEDLDVGAKVSAAKVVTAEGSYKSETKVLQEASEFMQFLKDQQTSLCNDYNTCKLTTQEYKERKDRINKAFTTVYALTKQIKVSDLDPETRKEILKKILDVIDEYNKPWTYTHPAEKGLKSQGSPTKVKENTPPADINNTTIDNAVKPKGGTIKNVPSQPEATGIIHSDDQSVYDGLDESLDEVKRQMQKMKKKALQIQKKAIEMQKNLEDDGDSGEEY